MNETELPAGWAAVPLADVADFYAGSSLPQGEEWAAQEDGHLLLRVSDLNLPGNEKTLLESQTWSPVAGARSATCPPGAVVIPKRGGAIATNKKRILTRSAILDPNLMAVRPREGVLDLFYLYYWFLGMDLRKLASGSQVPQLNKKDLAPLIIPLPTFSEQRRIVEALETHLSHLDAAQASLDRLHIKLDRAKRLVTDSTSGYRMGGASDGAPLPPSSLALDGQLPVLPKGWSWLRLHQIAEVVGGVTKDSKKQHDPSYPEVPYLRVANVQRGQLVLDQVSLIRVPQKKIEQLRLIPGDVLMNEGGDRDKLGRGWVWGGEMECVIHQNHVFRARLKDGVLHPKLLSWWANSMGKWFEVNGKQTTNLASISLKKIKELPVPVPPTELQEEIVKRVEEQLLLVGKVEQEVRLATRKAAVLRRNLLRKAFSGRLFNNVSDPVQVSQNPAGEGMGTPLGVPVGNTSLQQELAL